MSSRALVTGAALSSAVNVARMVLQALALPILARFLSPEDYGVVSMAMPFVLFLMMLADAGLATSLVRQPHVSIEEASSCHWVLTLLGSALALGLAAAAPLVSWIYGEPHLTWIMASLCLIIPMQVLTAVPGALLLKEQRYGAIALGEALATVVSIALAVALAVEGAGAAALVAQQLAFFAVRVVVCYAASRFWPRLVIDVDLVRSHYGFARDIVATQLVSFLSKSAENFIIGSQLGAASVGVFGLAFQLGRVPWMIVSGPFNYAVYPHLARLRDDREKLAASLLTYTRFLGMMIIPVMTVAVLASEPLIRVFLSEKWLPAEPIFMIIGIVMVLNPVTAVIGTFMMALGRTDIGLLVTIVTSAVWLLVAACAAPFGLEAVAAGYSLVTLAAIAWSLRLALGALGVPFAAYTRTFVEPLLLTLAAAATYGVGSHSMSVGSTGLVVLAFVTIAGVSGLSAWLQRSSISALRGA